VKSIQATALILWMVIFIVAAFVVGQFLASKDIFDISTVIFGNEKEQEETNVTVDDMYANEQTINKIGQETVRVGLNVVEEYFSKYYEGYINYLMQESDTYPLGENITIDNTLASDYVFYAVSSGINDNMYSSERNDGMVIITEAEINSFIEKYFRKEVEEAYKKQGKYGYDKLNKKYSLEESNISQEYIKELQEIENVNSNEIILTFRCKSNNKQKEQENIIKLNVLYKGGRYIVTTVQKMD